MSAAAPMMDLAPGAVATAATDASAQKAERERLRAEAERWLASLPSRTYLRRRGPHPRLVMHRAGASTPAFWEATWRVSPSYRMRGYALPRWYADVFTRRLPADGLIVEAGCGNGNLLRMLVNHDPARFGDFAGSGTAGRGACVEGLDFAENAIAENRRIHPEGRYRVGDVRDLPYRDGELAGYISMGVVEHFGEDDRRRILAEAARCLRPRGVAIITVPFFSPVRRALGAIGRFAPEPAAAEPGLEFYQFYFTLAEIRAELAAAGLRVVEIDGYDCRRGFTEAFGGDALLARLAHRSRRAARLIEQPPRAVRRLCPHMLMLVAERTGPDAAA